MIRSLQRVSIVVTCWPGGHVPRTLEALELLGAGDCEVVVVFAGGSSVDHISQEIEPWAERVKLCQIPDRNRALARNVGLELVAGEVVTFLDAGACPEPAWLSVVSAGFDRDEIAALGGPTRGAEFDGGLTYSVCSRLAEFRSVLTNPTDLLSAPYGDEVPCLHPSGASYRRERLVEIGGFNEEFENALVDADACFRLVDRGYVIKLHDSPNMLTAPPEQNQHGTPDLRDRIGFAFIHGTDTRSTFEVGASLIGQMESLRRCDQADRQDFDAIVSAFDAALISTFQSSRSSFIHPVFATTGQPWLGFGPGGRAADRLHIGFVVTEYPPRPVNGIGRVVHALAIGVAEQGHVVRVFTTADAQDGVEFREGVWVHRAAKRHHELPIGVEMPQGHWDESASMVDALIRVHERHPLDLVQVPNWAAEGVAAVLDGRFTTVLGMYTPLATVKRVDPRMAGPEIEQLVAMEERCYREVDAYLACGRAIVEEIEDGYGLQLDEGRIGFVPHGLPDTSGGVTPRRGPGSVNVLFVGRLEPRKGVDILLDGIPELAARFPELGFVLVGDDSIFGPDGPTYRTAFEQTQLWPSLADRVLFTGRVDDTELQEWYAGCDIFVAPSRYESFGLILIEAMMHSKPVIGCDVGGMRDIVEQGESGFLVPPDDSFALRDAIAALARSKELRLHLGTRGRELYEERYAIRPMAAAAVRFYRQVLGRADLAAP